MFKQFNTTNKNDIAEEYYGKYRPQIDALLANNTLRDVNESLGVDHVIMLGRQLDQFQAYQHAVAESYNGQGALGKLPSVALDVITASYGNSVLPLLASTQPIEEQSGLVYFRELRNVGSHGGFSNGQTILSPLTGPARHNGTLGAQRQLVDVGVGNGNTKEFTTTIGKPLVPGSVVVNVEGLGEGKDNGEGKLLTFGGYTGKIDYNTGKIDVVTDANLETDKKVRVMFDIEVDRAEAIDKIQAGLVTKEVRAEIWTLAADIGFFATFAAGKRFGRSNSDMVAEDLTNALVDSTNARVITALSQMKKSQVVWDQNAPQGVPYSDHKLSFVDAIARAEANLHSNAGAGSINRYVAGVTAASVLRGLPGFVLANTNPGQSVSLYGYLDGVPVIRATGVCEDNSVLAISNPSDYFNAPVAYCPYMPLMLTDTVQDSNNPFRSTRAAGVWAGIAAMNDNLVTEIKIKPMTLS